MKEMIVGLVLRHLISGVGAALIAKGYIDDSAWQTISGGLLATIALIASYFNKKRLTAQ